MSTGMIIDIVLAVILIGCVIVGAIRGFLKTVIAIIVTVVAIVGSVVLSGVLTPKVTDIVYPRVEDKLMKLVDEPSLHINIGAILSNATDQKIQDFLELEVPDDFFASGVPEDILKIAKQFGFTEEDLKKPVQSALKSAQDIMRKYLEKQKASGGSVDPESAGMAVEEANKAAAKAFLRPIVRAVLIIVLFILLSIILKIIAAAINRAAKDTPGVKQVNALGGAVLSLVECVVVFYLLLYLCNRFGMATALQDTFAQSRIITFLMKFIPA
ncbi:MAG: CvpA family protein [Firmicutes bacterium]|nr:CvpA family protein [Bacillota bacterium]